MSPTVVNGTHNSTRRTDEGVRILTPNAMLGYGYVPAHFWLGIERYRPHAIVVDSGSTDGGPYKLALGKMTCARQSYERDLSHMLQAAYHYGIKVLIGSAGGSGSNKHVDGMLEIINDICKREGYRFKTAAIYSGVTREHMSEHLAKGTVRPCGPVPDLTQREIDSAADMVAQIGVEPYLTALQDGADIIVAGRSYDPAPFAAFGQFHGIEAGVAWHCGKIMECGGICAVPKGRSMLATLHKDPDCFDLVPLNLTERCTPLSVAAHTLYEKTRPDLLPGPGGVLHLDGATYEQLPDNRTVRVRGAQFVPNEYNVKVEGAEIVGFRTIFIGGVRDPILISQIDKFLDAVHTYTSNLFPALRDGECQLLWHKYGANAVMGPLEPVKTPAHELGIMGEVVAPSQDLADAIANSARTSCLHMPYEGQLATTGNFASPLTPLEQPCGPVARFSIYHLIPCPEPANWPIKTLYLGVESPAERRAVPPMEVPTHIPDAVVVAGSSSFTAPAAPTPLASLAKVVRSKNSGPFELTLDVMFSEPQSYAYVKAAGILNQELIKKAYQIRDEDIMHIGWFEPALAWKCTIVRPWEQGSVGERDTLGTAQHAPLLDLVVPVPLTNKLAPSDRIFYPSMTAADSVAAISRTLKLPSNLVDNLTITGQEDRAIPSSFRIGHVAAASIGLVALLANLVRADRTGISAPVNVDVAHAVLEFKSERFIEVGGEKPPSPWGPIGGLYRCRDGRHVRVHDTFSNHRDGVARLLGCEAVREQVAEKLAAGWDAEDFERAALKAKLCVYMVRDTKEWAAHSQGSHISPIPVSVQSVAAGSSTASSSSLTSTAALAACAAGRPLAGLRVLELSRVIAAPVCGRTLAAHGADVLWVTSPNLPACPALDRDMARGKRSVQLDLETVEGRAELKRLIKTADVFVQSYRPGSMLARGFGYDEVTALQPNIIYAELDAFGHDPEGAWSLNRGFDSLVQTVSGMNVEEAKAYAKETGTAESPARPMPCQALDHAGGYLLCAGVLAALHRRVSGQHQGASLVRTSLAQAMVWLRSLGPEDPATKPFGAYDPVTMDDVRAAGVNAKVGQHEFVAHSGLIEGCDNSWTLMPAERLGADRPEWIQV